MASKEKSLETFIPLKISPFIPEDPDLWLALMRSQMLIYNITEPYRKYNYLISNLHPKYFDDARVREMLVNNETNYYYAYMLKEDYCNNKTKELLQRMRAPNIRRRLQQEEMGNQKPSQFLFHLNNLAGPHADVYDVKEQWIHKMPKEMQEILKSRMIEDINSLGRLADSLIVNHIIKEPDQIAVKNQIQQQNPVSESVANKCLLTAVDALSLQFTEFTCNFNRQLQELRQIISGMQNADQESTGKKVTKPD